MPDTEMNVDRRTNEDRRTEDVEVKNDRRKVQRRRQIDPTTCERDYTNDEIEFMQALDEYKRTNGRMFPTCSEILEVIRGLGYRRADDPDVLDEVESPALPVVDSAEEDAGDTTES